MIKSGKFQDKRILLIDKESKTKNDRTWCFWEKQDGFFEEIVYKKWDTISFFSDDYSADMNITPYLYKMIRGIDLYRYCFDIIEQQKNIDILYGEVTQAVIHKEGITIHIDGRMEHFNYATMFNSILPGKINLPDIISLLQHFKGWIIETPSPVFNPAKATFMDFRVSQERGTTFAYVLPFSATKALVEYTLFTRDLLKDEEYEAELKTYLNEYLKITGYTITEKEFGVIPMTTRKFDFINNGIYQLGTAGGQTKASSGYTFQFIQKQAEQICNMLVAGKSLSEMKQSSQRFKFYDRVLLDVLDKKRVTGMKVFTMMFKKNNPQLVLRFLDNESTLGEELKIISTLPKIPFIKAALKQF
jgi:lycopene beta-cyclase